MERRQGERERRNSRTGPHPNDGASLGDEGVARALFQPVRERAFLVVGPQLVLSSFLLFRLCAGGDEHERDDEGEQEVSRGGAHDDAEFRDDGLVWEMGETKSVSLASTLFVPSRLRTHEMRPNHMFLGGFASPLALCVGMHRVVTDAPRDTDRGHNQPSEPKRR